MKRGLYISMLLIAITTWILSMGLKLSLDISRGLPVSDMFTDPSVMFAVFLVPIWVAELYKFVTAERKRNVLDPHFVVSAGEPVIVRPLRGLLSMCFVWLGVLAFLGHGPFAGLLHPVALPGVFIAFGMLGVIMAFAPRTRLTLSPEGLQFSRMRPNFVPWHDVVDVKCKSILLNPRVILTLKNATEFRSANPLARWRPVESVVLLPFALGLDAEALTQGIEARRSVFAF